MRWWWKVCVWFVRVSGAALWTFRSYGVENVPRTGGVILASNHQSYLDPVLVAVCLPREIHFMARRTLFRTPVFRAMITAMNAFPIDRGSVDLKGTREAIARLKAGAVLLVFPEGTRTRDGTIGRMKQGTGMIAGRASVPIVPVLIEGAHRVWPKGGLPSPVPGKVRIVFGRPLSAASADGDRIRQAVMSLKGVHEGCRTDGS